jgi:hypothetical protein
MTQSSPNQVFGIDHIDNNGTKITETEATVTDDTNNDNEIMQIITDAENITNFNLQHYLTTRIKIDACFDNVAPSVFASDERIMNGITKLKERGIKIRLITDITKDNIDYCKEIMNISEVRHLEGVKGNFGIIDEREYNIHIIHQESKAPTQIIYCNVKSSAEAQQFLFNTLWNKAILADQRIREIEEGIKPDFIETIRDPIEIARIRSEIINSATEEILIVIPTVNDWMYPRTVYHRNGFAKKDVLMCDDCHKIERRFYESRLTTHVTEHKAYEVICMTIKEKTSSKSFSHHNNNRSTDDKETGNGIVNYYDTIRVAYQNSEDVRENLNCTLEDVNKDLKTLEIYLPTPEFRTQDKSCQQGCQ